MKCNVGKADRIIRIIVRLGVLAAGIYFKSWFGAIGAIYLVTAALGWCPLYLPVGISSVKSK